MNRASLYDEDENSVDSVDSRVALQKLNSAVPADEASAAVLAGPQVLTHGLLPQIPPGCTQEDLDLFKRVKEMSARALKTDDAHCKNVKEEPVAVPQPVEPISLKIKSSLSDKQPKKLVLNPIQTVTKSSEPASG